MWFKQHKYHAFAVLIILLLFSLSLFIRQKNLKAPLARKHEWIAAHALITAEIWDENNGPSAYGFCPVYTYPGKGNSNSYSLGGIIAKDGKSYYTSYPPFSFILLYYSSQAMGGPTVSSIRIVALLIHLFASILIYFILVFIRPPNKTSTMSYAGIIAAGMYVFAQENLWIHGNLFFADMAVQPFILGILLAVVLYTQGYYKSTRKIHLTIFLLVFFATFTEWLGLLLALTIGCTFLILGLIKKKRHFMNAFILTAIASGLALSTTIIMYSNIAGWNTYLKVSTRKYAERSGHSVINEVDAAHSLNNANGLNHIIKTFNSNYLSSENFLGITFILLIAAILCNRLIKRRAELQWNSIKPSVLILTLLSIPVLSHYLLFYNFNSLHDFSALKTATVVILTIGIFVQFTLQISFAVNRKLGIVMILVFFFVFILKSKKAVYRYLSAYKEEMIDYDLIKSAEVLGEHSSPEITSMSNAPWTPQQVYYAKHNIARIPEFDTTTIKQFMNSKRVKDVNYFHYIGSRIQFMKKLELDGLSLVCRDSINLER